MKKKSIHEGENAYCYFKQRGERGKKTCILNLEVNNNLKQQDNKPSQQKEHVVDLWFGIPIIVKYVAFQRRMKDVLIKQFNGFVLQMMTQILSPGLNV